MRGDLLLEAKKYRQAAYIYMELLEPEYTRQMTEELKGNIMHNLGVAYARLFLFPEAAQMFVQAYHLRRSDETRQAYLYAMNYVGDGSEFFCDEGYPEPSFGGVGPAGILPGTAGGLPGGGCF